MAQRIEEKHDYCHIVYIPVVLTCQHCGEETEGEKTVEFQDWGRAVSAALELSQSENSELKRVDMVRAYRPLPETLARLNAQKKGD